MQRMKASDFPQEVLNLFDRYVHGGIDPRQFIDKASKYAVGGMTATAMFEALKPNFALGEQISATDSRIKGQELSYPSPQGNSKTSGYFLRPANAPGKLPTILVVHENRGLNPHIRDIARRLAVANFLAFAPDALAPVGGYPGDEEKATEMFGKLDNAKRTEDFVAAAGWIKGHAQSTGKLGSVGFCFGGGVCNTPSVRPGEWVTVRIPFVRAQPPSAAVRTV